MKKVDLLEGPIDSTLRRFTVPLAFSFIVHMLYAWVDTYYVSQISDTAIAAIGMSEQLIFFIFTIGGGFAIGSGVVVARRIGEKEQTRADETATQAVVLMLVLSLLLSIILYFGISLSLSAMNVTGELHNLSKEYLSAVVLGVPGSFVVFQLNAIVRSAGNSQFPMYVLIMGTILNAILSPLFIFGIGPFPEWGIYGAGFATAVAQTITLVIAFIGVWKKMTPISFSFVNFRIDFSIVTKIFKISIPVTLQFLSVSVNRLLLFTIANAFGTSVVAVYTLGIKVDLFVFMSVFAVGAAIEITTGQNLGAGNLKRIFLYYKSALKQLSVIMIVLGVSAFFFGENFARIFTDSEDIISQSAIYLKITAFSYIPFSIGLLSTKVLSGAGDTQRSLKIVAAILLVFQLPLAYLLSHYTDLAHIGIWYGILASQILFAIVGCISVRNKKWLKIRI